MAAIPVADPDAPTRPAPLAGERPDPANPPPGCRFHTRCPYADDFCRHVPPRPDRAGARPFRRLSLRRETAARRRVRAGGIDARPGRPTACASDRRRQFGFMTASHQRALHHRRPMAGRLPVGPRPPRAQDAEPGCAGGRRRALPQSFRAVLALRAEPRLAADGHVHDEPPIGAQRHAARRALHQCRARGAQGRLRSQPDRLHRYERRPAPARPQRSRALDLCRHAAGLQAAHSRQRGRRGLAAASEGQGLRPAGRAATDLRAEARRQGARPRADLGARRATRPRTATPPSSSTALSASSRSRSGRGSCI